MLDYFATSASFNLMGSLELESLIYTGGNNTKEPVYDDYRLSGLMDAVSELLLNYYPWKPYFSSSNLNDIFSELLLDYYRWTIYLPPVVEFRLSFVPKVSVC